MKKTILFCALGLCSLVASAVTDIYAFKASLLVPQVKENTASLGYRKYERQVVTGRLSVSYNDDGEPTLSLYGLTNKNFKVSGVKVTYDATIDGYPRWNLIGSNKTGVFKTPSVHFSADLQPSYVAAFEPTDDNSLVLSLSGRGSSYKLINGYVTGTLGCGCSDYGHVSPTRVMGSGIVDDVASVYGSWSAKLISRTDK